MAFDERTHVSEHLAWSELACHDAARTPYPVNWRASRAKLLAVAFEQVRALWGQPLTILSAYRTFAHNRAIGGAQYSQHVQGRAVDLAPPAGVPVEAFYRQIAALVRSGETPIKGLGRYARFVHIDTRPAPDLVAWSEATSNGDAERGLAALEGSAE